MTIVPPQFQKSVVYYFFIKMWNLVQIACLSVELSGVTSIFDNVFWIFGKFEAPKSQKILFGNEYCIFNSKPVSIFERLRNFNDLLKKKCWHQQRYGSSFFKLCCPISLPGFLIVAFITVISPLWHYDPSWVK